MVVSYTTTMKKIDLGITKQGIGRKLSNFYLYPFVLDDVQCSSMETFIQCLKYPNFDTQLKMASMAKSFDAYKEGQRTGNGWKDTQTIWWRENPIQRGSERYYLLMARAYDACYDQNIKFREALLSSEFDVLTHDIGKHDQTQTLLTVSEYLHNMYRLRSKAMQDFIENDDTVS